MYMDISGMHGYQEPGCDKLIIPHAEAIVTINVGLVQARPNKQ